MTPPDKSIEHWNALWTFLLAALAAIALVLYITDPSFRDLANELIHDAFCDIEINGKCVGL